MSALYPCLNRAFVAGGCSDTISPGKRIQATEGGEADASGDRIELAEWPSATACAATSAAAAAAAAAALPAAARTAAAAPTSTAGAAAGGRRAAR